MASKLLILGAALPAFAAIIPSIETRAEKIVGGEPVKAGEIPYIVSLSGADGGHFCGGSLINENTVVTAAHCVVDGDAASSKVRAGSITASGGGVQVGAAEFIPHPDYDAAGSTSDIAIVKLSEPIPEGDGIGYVTLPEAGSDLQANTTVRVAGWGATTTGGTDPSDDLLKVEVPAVGRDACSDAWGFPITETQVCAGLSEGGKDACFGDSGGPLVIAETDVLVGTVSFGKPCAQPNGPTVYGNVAALLDFVSSNS